MYANAQNADLRRTTIRASVKSLNRAGRGRIDMNRDRVHGMWKQFGGNVRQHWGVLSDDPLAVAVGARDRLAGRIQEQRGISKQAADRQLEAFMSRNRNWSDLSKR